VKSEESKIRFGYNLLLGSPYPSSNGREGIHYLPIFTYQVYVRIGFLISLHSGKKDIKIILTFKKMSGYQNWQF